MGFLQNPRSLHKHHASFFRYRDISLTLLGCPETLHGLPTVFLSGGSLNIYGGGGGGWGAFSLFCVSGRQVPSAWGCQQWDRAWCFVGPLPAVQWQRAGRRDKSWAPPGTSTVFGGPCRWTGRTKATLQPLLWNDKGMHWEASQVIDSPRDLCRSPRMQVNHLWFILMVRMGKARTFTFVPFLLK